MATISICNRLNGKPKRFKVEGVNISSKVAEFRSKVAKVTEIPVQEIELIYCGQKLQDDKTLNEYTLQPGSTVHALKKAVLEEQIQAPEPLDSTSVQQVVTALQAALMNPAYRNVVEKILKNSDSLDNIIAASPGLDRDPVALAILQDADLLAILADPSHIQKVIEAHPSLGHAAMSIAATVNEETATEGAEGNAVSVPGTYSLDQMSDDEDLEPVRPRSSAGGGGAGAGTITASQLAAAFAAVTGGSQASMLSPQSSGSQSSSSPSGNQQPFISADFFSQALSQIAAGGTGGADNAGAGPSSSAGATPQGPPEEVILSQLAQLRDMGIDDEAAARHALVVAGGDLQAALDILFGGS